jgi:hypothetical protein
MYKGTIVGQYIGGVFVTDTERIIERVDGEHRSVISLQESLKHVRHSPTGFCWGYCGSGPHQLAFAILFDYLKDKRRVLPMYSEFARKVISALPIDAGFELPDRTIEDFITKFDIERMKAN